MQLMRKIYSCADRVASWVGSAEDDTAEAVKYLLERSSSQPLPLANPASEDELPKPLSSPKFGMGRLKKFTGSEISLESGRYSREGESN